MQRVNLKRWIARLLAMIMLLTAMVPSSFRMVVKAAGTDINLFESGGWLESAYVKWTPAEAAEGYTAYVKKASEDDSAYTKLANELIRKYPTYYRADAVGLAEGSYVLKVVPVAAGEEVHESAQVTSELSVSAHTREGFAFSEFSTYKTGSGGYKEDGTVRDDAQIIYLTNENKDTVTLDVITGSNTETGIGIVDILSKREKGKDTRPLIIRMIGKVETPTGVSGSLLNIKKTFNVTVEGIGNDATAYGWGFLVREGKNIEIRNLGIMWFGDDAISLDTKNENVWIHNNDIFYGKPGSASDQVKGDGSVDVKAFSTYVTVSYNHFWDSGKSSLAGMKDTEEFFITYHHNWFDHSDSRHPRIRAGSIHIYNNYFDGVSKYGIGVTNGASAFSENNYFRNCKYPMLSSGQGSDKYESATGGYTGEGTFSKEDGGIIKEFGNVIIGATRFVTQHTTPDEGQIDAYTVESREEQIPSSVVTMQGGTPYNNFDTDPNKIYSYVADTAEVGKAKTELYAGRINGGDFKWSFDVSEDTNYEIIPELQAAIREYQPELVSIGGIGDVKEEPTGVPTVTPTGEPTEGPTGAPTPTQPPSSGAYSHNFTTQGITSTVYTITGNLSTSKGSVQYNGLTLTQCLKMEGITRIEFTAPGDGTYLMVFNPLDGKVNAKVNGTKFTGNAETGILTIDVLAGTSYTIEKADTSNLFYMGLSFEEQEVPTPTPTEIPTGEPTPTPTEIPTGVPTVTPTPIPPESSVEGDIFVAPYAPQDAKGTFEEPMELRVALTKIKAGNTIWMLPGNYSYSEMIVVEKLNSGSTGAYKTVRSYSGNVVLDFSTQAYDTSNRGVVQDGDYWKWYGIDFKGAGDNGMLLSGNHNIIEMCRFYENRDTGLQLSRYDVTAATIDKWPSYNLIKNCTSFNNSDHTGENADGFAAKLTCGEGNVFDGCMSYNNSDDGWDLYAKSETGPIGIITLKNCIAFRNGKLTSGSGSASGDMNGFKLGGSGIATPHIIENCMAFENGAHGFTDNNNPAALIFKNITAFENGVYNKNKANFQIDRAKQPTVYNAIGVSTNKIGSDKIVSAIGARVVYMNSSKYYEYEGSVGGDFDSTKKVGAEIKPVASDIFVSITAPDTSTDFHTVWRNSDGSINTHGFLQIKENNKYASFSTEGGVIGAVFGIRETPEPTPEVTPEPTPEVTPEPTPEVTPNPTPEATPNPEPETNPNTNTEPSVKKEITKNEDGGLTTTIITTAYENDITIVTTESKVVDKNDSIVQQSKNILYQNSRKESLEIVIRKDRNDKVIFNETTLYTTVSEAKDYDKNLELTVSMPLELLKISQSNQDAGTEKTIKLELPTNDLKDQVSKQSVDNVVLNLNLQPQAIEQYNCRIGDIILSQSVIKTFAGKDKNLTVNVKEEGRSGYSWTFDKEALSGSIHETQGVNLQLNVRKNANIDLQGNNEKVNHTIAGTVIDFSHSGKLPVSSLVNISVTDAKNNGNTLNNKLYLYYFDQKSSKLLELPNNEYTIDENGYVNIAVNHCSSYVMLSQKPSKEIVVSLLDQIKVNNKNNIYIGGTKDWEWVALRYPSTLKVVKSFTGSNTDLSSSEIMIRYKSDNAKIATVSQTGKITGKSKGTTIIYITVTLPDGTEKQFQQQVAVKEANFALKKSVSSMVLGERIAFTVEANGYRAEDIVWMTAKREIAIVGKNYGKLTAFVSAQSLGEDYVVVSVVDKNGKVISSKAKVKITQ